MSDDNLVKWQQFLATQRTVDIQNALEANSWQGQPLHTVVRNEMIIELANREKLYYVDVWQRISESGAMYVWAKDQDEAEEKARAEDYADVVWDSWNRPPAEIEIHSTRPATADEIQQHGHSGP